MARRRINQAQPDALFPRGQRPRDRMTPAATDRGATFRQPSDPRNTQQTRGGMGLNPDQLRNMYDSLPGRARAEFLAQHPAFNPNRQGRIGANPHYITPPGQVPPGSDSGARGPLGPPPGTDSGARGPQPHGWGLRREGYSAEEAARIKNALQQGGYTRDQYLQGAAPNVNQSAYLPEPGTAFTSGSPWRFWLEMKQAGRDIPPPPDPNDQQAMMAWNATYRAPKENGGTTWNYGPDGQLHEQFYDAAGWHDVGTPGVNPGGGQPPQVLGPTPTAQPPQMGPQNAQRPPQGQGNQNPAPGVTMGTPGVSQGTAVPGPQVQQPPQWQMTVPTPGPVPNVAYNQGQYASMNYDPQTGQTIGSGDSRFIDPNTGQPANPADFARSQAYAQGQGAPDPRQGFGPQVMGLVPAQAQTYGPQQVPPGATSGARPLPPASDSGARPPGSEARPPQSGLPLSGELEAYRRAAEDNLAASLARVGIQRDQIPAMTNLIIQRLRTDENETNDAIAEASNARGVRGRRDFDRAELGFSRQRQDIALDVASQLADLADQESGAHSKYLKDLAEGILNYGRDLAQDPRAPVDRTNNDEPVKRRRRAGQRNRNRRRRGK